MKKSPLDPHSNPAAVDSDAQPKDVSQIQAHYSSLIQERKADFAKLSERFSRIKAQLKEACKTDSMNESQLNTAIEQLSRLLEVLPAEKPMTYIYLNCKYLLGCCILYQQCTAKPIDIDQSYKAYKILDSLKTETLAKLEYAQKMSYKFYLAVYEILGSADAHSRRNTIRSYQKKRIEPPLRKILGERIFEQNYVKHLFMLDFFIQNEMPVVAKDLLHNAIDYDSRFGQAQIISPRT